MSRTRINPDEAPRAAFVLTDRLRAGTVPWHTHRRAQLIYMKSGVLTVWTDKGFWVVPPLRAVWVLPGIRHQVTSRRPYSLCTLYVEPNLARLPAECTVVDIEPLVRELLIAAARFGYDYVPGGPDERLIQVILDRIPQGASGALHLPECHDERMRGVTDALTANPADARSLKEWGRLIGMSERNLARAFVKDLGVTFGEWRQQLRLLIALERLAHGEPVSEVAAQVGYRDAGAFSARFKAALGDTPGHYFRDSHAPQAKSPRVEVASAADAAARRPVSR